MRLHRLEVEAFGPFATRQVVDVDALSSEGVFLLHGPTGAGKTSVLDAVCFALFGQLPGARREGRPRLRSDHAEATAAPRVVLELTIGGRRLEVTRSPEWQRPKKRGQGTTREPAATDVRELVDGEWRVLVARRSDEAALLLHDLLGMGLEQFTKVVMLPQGEFAAFLRAGAQQRAELLSRLFDIDRYAGVESWLRDERQRLARLVATADGERDALVARAQQAALPVVGAVAAVAGSADEVALADPPGPALVEALSAAVSAALIQARTEAAVAQDHAATTGMAWRAGEELSGRLRRRSDLLATLRQLDADDHQRRTAVVRLDAARRAQRLAVVLPRLADATAAETSARERVTARLTALPESLADLANEVRGADVGAAVVDQLRAQLDERVRELDRLEAARAQDDELRRLQRRCAELRDQVELAQRTVGETSARLPEHLTRLAGLRDRQDLLVAQAARLDAAREALAAARDVAQAADQLATCSHELAAHEKQRRSSGDRELQAQARLLSVRERRLLGMAAALAGGLGTGEPCPVCGSVEHPRPAPTGPDHVDAAEEELAQSELDAARAAREEADRAHGAVAQRHAALSTAAAGQSVTAAQAAVDARAQELARAEAAADSLERVRGELVAQQAEYDADVEVRQGAERRRDEAQALLEELTSRCDHLTGALTNLLAGAQDLASRRTVVAAEREALDTLLDAVRADTAARTRADDLRATAAVAATQLGFPDLATAQQAWLEEEVLAGLEQVVREHERLRADTEAVLATPELRDLDAVAPPELDALRTAAEQAEQRSEAARRALTIAQQAHDALLDLLDALREHDDVHRELRARHRHVDELSRCVDGTGGGNVRRMRLSAFVLAARLEEVAVAASERLVAMSDGRYTLAHSDDLAKGGARSGLGLEVVDSWTGVAREPSTLSGGESFIASLALALGLADVVQAEAGGTDIETLFVDEGFGSLDDDALEEVMAVLDGLRSGGRTVGIVSHVADLRSRIHQQLEVVKTRTGSTVRHRCGDAATQAAS